jgi:hypothetical protein
VRPHTTDELLDSTRSVPRAHASVVVRSVSDNAEFPLVTEDEVRLDAGQDGLLTPVILSRATLDPRTAAAGAPLARGEWQVVVQPRIGGFNATAMTVRQPGEARPAPLSFAVGADGRIDPGPWVRRAVSGRLPRPVARGLRRARAAVRAARPR